MGVIADIFRNTVQTPDLKQKITLADKRYSELEKENRDLKDENNRLKRNLKKSDD